VIKCWRDLRGSILVEYTIVFPMFLLVALGTLDVSYMLADWAAANKATYLAVRYAIVSNPVAKEITSPSYSEFQQRQIGQPCFDRASGLAIGNCPSVDSMSSDCTGTIHGGTCTNGYMFDDTAANSLPFTNILTRMQALFCPHLAPPYAGCPLQRQNVTISYAATGAGYVLRPGGLPMTVTVSLKCMTHQFYFIGTLLRWTFAPQKDCPGPVSGWPVPTFASTLTSEDLQTN
jgi:hypothetical protein